MAAENYQSTKDMPFNLKEIIVNRNGRRKISQNLHMITQTFFLFIFLITIYPLYTLLHLHPLPYPSNHHTIVDAHEFFLCVCVCLSFLLNPSRLLSSLLTFLLFSSMLFGLHVCMFLSFLLVIDF